MSIVKNILRELCIFFHLDLTKNLKYDRLTRSILRQYLKKNCSCIDVGCHKGEILDLMLRYAPNGSHWAFEPIPYLYEQLKNKYSSHVHVLPYALSDTQGKSSFHFVKNAPAYSGIKKRRYAISDPSIEEIEVDMHILDELIGPTESIQFIKIDVEGGEFGVMKGARRLLKDNQPLVLFECGQGASDHYGTQPEEIFRFLVEEIGLSIYTLHAFIRGEKALSIDQFSLYFHNNEEYYFVASASSLKA